MSRANKVLLVDSSANERSIVDVFSREGYTCISIDSHNLLNSLDDNKIACIILQNVMGSRCFEVCKYVRRESVAPIIVLSNVADSNDAIRALNLGADDYLVKPYDPYEILARIKAIARRARVHMMEEDISIGPLKIDMDKFAVYINGTQVSMPPREMKLLNFLASNPDKALSRAQVLEEVWGFEFFGDSRTVDVHIKRIREKIESLTDRIRISTVWGIGYKFEYVNN